SGSGKTTLGRAILRLVDPAQGGIHFEGEDITRLQRKDLKRYRTRVQVIFQDPFGSLNPRMSVGDTLAEAAELVESKGAITARVAELLDLVGLPRDAASRYPHEFSGGQRQRIGIARALAVRPEMIIADEPVSALDVSIQAQIVNLLQDLQGELGLTMLFIAHDLAVVRHISDRIGVMYLGRLMEVGPADAVVASPSHPYTRALLSAVPVPDPARQVQRQILEGDLPSPIHPPSGCVFRTRCPQADPGCAAAIPDLVPIAEDRVCACLQVNGPAA
ncbi:MAG: ATP-binding cassette domain-containing protein, partial [Bacteroidetes bacterium]|nr:ATP-binding cassette domain-containing protein [Bacteroidota bacterium]